VNVKYLAIFAHCNNALKRLFGALCMKYSKLFNVISIPVFFVLYLFTAIVVLLVVIFSMAGVKSMVQLTTFYWGKLVFLLMFKKIHTKGFENIDKTKKYILVANHASLFDIPAIMSVYPNLAWFGREYLMKIPILGKALKMNGYIPMKKANVRNTKIMLQQLIQQAGSQTIAMFPEGTRTLNGNLQRFHRGFIHLMKASELDVLPITLNGFFSLKPKIRSSINFCAKLELIVHKPISFEHLWPKNDDEIIEIVKNEIESAYKLSK